MDVKMWITVILFGISIGGAVSSYYKSTGAIEEKVTKGIADTKLETATMMKEFRQEIRDTYATKENANFQNQTLQEIKADVKEIKGSLGRSK